LAERFGVSATHLRLRLGEDREMEDSKISEKLFDWLLGLETVMQYFPPGNDAMLKPLSEIRQEMRTILFEIDDENARYYRSASVG